MKNEKKLIIILGITLTIILCWVFFSSNKVNLNDTENQVYERLIEYTKRNEVFNPSEIRLLEATVRFKYNDNERKYGSIIEYYYFRLSGTNKIGGTINKCYWSYYNDYNNSWTFSEQSNCNDLNKTGINIEKLSIKSIKNINKNLKSYWSDLGI